MERTLDVGMRSKAEWDGAQYMGGFILGIVNEGHRDKRGRVYKVARRVCYLIGTTVMAWTRVFQNLDYNLFMGYKISLLGLQQHFQKME